MDGEQEPQSDQEEEVGSVSLVGSIVDFSNVRQQNEPMGAVILMQRGLLDAVQFAQERSTERAHLLHE